MNKIKPRTIIVDINIDKGESVEAIWNKKKQEVIVNVLREDKKVSAKKVILAMFYGHPKKPKFLNLIEYRRSSDVTLSHSDSLKLYSQIWAIDTNKKEIFDQNAYVSGVTVCSTNGTEEYYPVLAIIFGQTKNNPELYGWRKFIEFIQLSDIENPTHRYGLVVDSEFSKIPDFNDRKIPIHGNFYLPTNWDLIYATSDSGKESIFNKILSESDKTSSEVLKSISEIRRNAKYWNPIIDEEQHQPYYLILVECTN